MAEAQLTNAVSLADSPIHKRRPGRPPGSRKKDEAEIKPIAMPSFLQKEKRPRGRPRIHPPKDPLAEKRPRGRPKTTPDSGEPKKPKGPRGRPKGSKNKVKTGEEVVKKPKGPRGRPKKIRPDDGQEKVKGKRGRPKMESGLKVKIVVRKPSTSSAESVTNGVNTATSNEDEKVSDSETIEATSTDAATA